MQLHWHNVNVNLVRRLELKFDFRPPLADPAVVCCLEPDLAEVAHHSSLQIWFDPQKNCVLSNIFKFFYTVVVEVIHETHCVSGCFVACKVEAINCVVLIKAFSKNLNLFRAKPIMRHVKMNQSFILFKSLQPFFCRGLIQFPFLFARRQFVLMSFLS